MQRHIVLILTMMFHWNRFMWDGYFGDRHYDNSKVVLDYNSF
jgi:hypothetical protein